MDDHLPMSKVVVPSCGQCKFTNINRYCPTSSRFQYWKSLESYENIWLNTKKSGGPVLLFKSTWLTTRWICWSKVQWPSISTTHAKCNRWSIFDMYGYREANSSKTHEYFMCKKAIKLHIAYFATNSFRQIRGILPCSRGMNHKILFFCRIEIRPNHTTYYKSTSPSHIVSRTFK